jgi:hypothetical protein
MLRVVWIALFSLLLASTRVYSASWPSPQAPALVNPTLYFPYCAHFPKCQNKKDKKDPSDYRPVLSADGSKVIFERTLHDETIANLFIASINPLTTPGPFIPAGAAGTSGSQRADWCWKRSSNGAVEVGPVAFSNNDGIWVAHASGLDPVSGPIVFLDTAGMIYPAWYPDCQALAVDVVTGGAKVKGRWLTAQLDAVTGKVIAAPLANASVWAGFPSVNQANPNYVAFAGQPNDGNANYYNQETNYSWVTDRSSPWRPIIKPIERQVRANSGFIGKFQARAGWWSPDGRWFAFESNRACNDISGTTYAIFIVDSQGFYPPMQVSDCIWNAQHPKWFPSGPSGVSTMLIAAVQYNSEGPNQIATFDVTAFVKQR